MKTSRLFEKFSIAIAILSLSILTSCKNDINDLVNDKVLNEGDVTDVSSESITDASYHDSDDLSIYAIANHNVVSGGRISGTDDYRLIGAIITHGPNNTDVSGTMTVDFGEGLADEKGNTRKGKIAISYSNGPISNVGSILVVTFDGYSINDIKLEGTRTITKVTPSADTNVKHHIVLKGGKATWPDNTFASRSSELDRELNAADGILTLSGSASGVSRKGKNYEVSTTETLVFKKTCVDEGIYMAVDGAKLFLIDGKSVAVEFGDGACDKVVTVTYLGVAKEVTVNKN